MPHHYHITQALHHPTLRDPFKDIKARWLVVWLLLEIPILLITVFAAGLSTGEEELSSNLMHIIMAVFNAIFFGALLLFLKKKKIPLRTLIGPLPHVSEVFRYITVIIPLLMFSMATLLSVWYIFSFFDPTFTDKLLGKEVDPLTKNLNPILNILTAVIFAPIVEELLFRAILLRRWIVKWQNIRKAIIISSLLFAVLHGDNFIGMFLFGVTLSVVYLKTGKLMIPIFTHAAYNSLVTLFTLGSSQPPQPETLPQKPEDLLPAMFILFAISSLWLHRFIRKNWPEVSSV